MLSNAVRRFLIVLKQICDHFYTSILCFWLFILIFKTPYFLWHLICSCCNGGFISVIWLIVDLFDIGAAAADDNDQRQPFTPDGQSDSVASDSRQSPADFRTRDDDEMVTADDVVSELDNE